MRRSKQSILSTASLFLLIAVVTTSGCQQRPDPSQQFKPIIDRFARVWNGADLKELDAFIDPQIVRSVNFLPEVHGINGLKKAIADFRTAYPDFKLVVEDEVYAENVAAVRWSFTGTNTGPGATPPTGKSVKMWGNTILHFANGKVTEERVAYDSGNLMEQLGYTMTPPVAPK